ncbi:hypothetical protein Tco_0760127 [Tanacetum coccineum]
MSRIISWKEVTDKISSRLSKWKIKTLSSGGRLTLLKSVLTALLLYYMSIYKAPAVVLKDLESIRRDFSMVLIRLIEKWFGFVGKRSWRQRTMVGLASLAYMPPTGLFSSNRYGDFSLNVLPSGLVSLKQFMDLKEISMILKQRSVDLYGRSDSALKITHPRLFTLELKKDITVAEKMGNASLNLSFRRLPRSGIEDEQYKNLVSITSDVLLPQMHDR